MGNPDAPYALVDLTERTRRQGLLTLPAYDSFRNYLDEVRSICKLTAQVPDFDPCDGGVTARALFLLEAPGPQAVASGFVSRNNPDPTARNMCELLSEAGLLRKDTLLWNVVPWYCGDGQRIQAPSRDDIRKGLTVLPKLLAILRDLRCVVLVGRKAQQARSALPKGLTIIETFHPSNRVRFAWREKYQSIQSQLAEVRLNIQRASSNF